MFASMRTPALCLLLPWAAAAQPSAETAAPGAPASEAPTAPASDAHAALPPIPDQRLYLTSLSLFRLNPLGLETQARFGFQHRLFDADSLALRDNFWYAGTFVRLNPASARTAAVVELQPVSLVNLRVTAEYLRFFGTVGYLQSAPDAGADFSDSSLKDAEEHAYGAGGLHVTFEPLIQAKVGPVAVRSRALIGWFDMDLREGDRVFYEATLDAPLADEGLVIANDLDVIYVTDFGLNAGVRYTAVLPRYSKSQNADDTDTSHHRAGLLAAYTFFDEGYTSFNKPTVLAITSWYLKHRYRTGEDVSQAVPYVVLGFAFTSDVLAAR